MTVALGACGQSGGSAAATAEDDGRVECRIAGDIDFQRYCTLQHERGEAGHILIVRKPDGGFRRFLVTRDGRGVAAADGAEQPQVTLIADDRIEVAIGGDTFRLPARVRRP